MKKLLLGILSAAMAASAMTLVACGETKNGASLFPLEKAPQFISKTLVDFTGNTSTILEISDDRGNGDPFGVIWEKDNVTFDQEKGEMTFALNKEGDVYYGSEIKTTGEVGAIQYGYFGCVMKPSNVYGTASTFFTYTGDYEGNPHDEIDIEFLGKDTTKVQFNYFVNDVGSHEYWYDLGFDASEEFHQYGFYWDEEKLVWYVDYQPVYGVYCQTGGCPQRVYTNFWSGETSNSGIMGWMGRVKDETLPATTVYKEITVAYLNGSGVEVPEPEYLPQDGDFIAFQMTVNQGSTDMYFATLNEDGSTTITYDNIGSKTYKNIYGTLPEEVKAAKYLTFKVRNNGAEDYVKVRVDVQADKVNAAGIKAINECAWMNGEPVSTDLVYGGSFFDVLPGEEVTCIVRFYGEPSKLLFMLDSCTRTDKEVFAGSVTISAFGYFGENDYVEENVTISSNYQVLKTGETVQLTAQGTGEVTWSVENPNVATVENGLVTAVGEGTTTVYAKVGAATATCTIKVSDKEPKQEETMPIVSDATDKATLSCLGGSDGTKATETENVYGTSLEGVSWTGAGQYNVMFVKTGDYNITADGYIEYFLKNVGHVPTGEETVNGGFVQLYKSDLKTKVGSEIKVYKGYNLDCATDAGNGWYCWRLPLSLFEAESGATFGAFRFKLYAAMNEGEYLYFDGINVVAGTTTEPTEPTEPTDPTTVDHSAETLAICNEATDLFDNEHIIENYNGTIAYDTDNRYGASEYAVKWTGVSQYQNRFVYVKGDMTAATITEGAYIEFFIKSVGHTSSSEDFASGVILKFYNGDTSTKVTGAQDVKVYKTNNADYRVSAGNGWYRYQLPLTLFGELNASFDRVRFMAYAQFDEGEAMYLDGFNLVVPGGSTEPTEPTEPTNPSGIDHSVETYEICSEADDMFDDEHIINNYNGTIAHDTDNRYGTSEYAVKWTGVSQYQNRFVYVKGDMTAATITEGAYIEFFIKSVGHTSSSEDFASGVILKFYNGDTSTKVTGAQDVKVYKTNNADYRVSAGNGWYRYQLPLTLFGELNASFDRVRFMAYAQFDEGEAMYLDGFRLVTSSAQQTEEPSQPQTETYADKMVELNEVLALNTETQDNSVTYTLAAADHAEYITRIDFVGQVNYNGNDSGARYFGIILAAGGNELIANDSAFHAVSVDDGAKLAYSLEIASDKRLAEGNAFAATLNYTAAGLTFSVEKIILHYGTWATVVSETITVGGEAGVLRENDTHTQAYVLNYSSLQNKGKIVKIELQFEVTNSASYGKSQIRVNGFVFNCGIGDNDLNIGAVMPTSKDGTPVTATCSVTIYATAEPDLTEGSISIDCWWSCASYIRLVSVTVYTEQVA